MIQKTIGERIIDFNQNLKFSGDLPVGYGIINPFKTNPLAVTAMHEFYTKFYNDFEERKFIIGINPSRHGAAITGVPFTDTKRLLSDCNIKINGVSSHEISSVFMYTMINSFGGPDRFYSEFYINSPFPFAIVKNVKGQLVNANYYDDPQLFNVLRSYMTETLKVNIELGLRTDVAYILGLKNGRYISTLNKEYRLFKKLVILEHPRFIQQYKSKDVQIYIDKYLESFKTK